MPPGMRPDKNETHPLRLLPLVFPNGLWLNASSSAAEDDEICARSQRAVSSASIQSVGDAGPAPLAYPVRRGPHMHTFVMTLRDESATVVYGHVLTRYVRVADERRVAVMRLQVAAEAMASPAQQTAGASVFHPAQAAYEPTAIVVLTMRPCTEAVRALLYGLDAAMDAAALDAAVSATDIRPTNTAAAPDVRVRSSTPATTLLPLRFDVRHAAAVYHALGGLRGLPLPQLRVLLHSTSPPTPHAVAQLVAASPQTLLHATSPQDGASAVSRAVSVTAAATSAPSSSPRARAGTSGGLSIVATAAAAQASAALVRHVFGPLLAAEPESWGVAPVLFAEAADGGGNGLRSLWLPWGDGSGGASLHVYLPPPIPVASWEVPQAPWRCTGPCQRVVCGVDRRHVASIAARARASSQQLPSRRGDDSPIVPSLSLIGADSLVRGRHGTLDAQPEAAAATERSALRDAVVPGAFPLGHMPRQNADAGRSLGGYTPIVSLLRCVETGWCAYCSDYSARADVDGVGVEAQRLARGDGSAPTTGVAPLPSGAASATPAAARRARISPDDELLPYLDCGSLPLLYRGDQPACSTPLAGRSDKPSDRATPVVSVPTPPQVPALFTRPARATGFVPLDVDARALLGRLSPRNVIALLTSLLAERNVLVVCADTSVLHDAMMTALALLQPLRWVGAFAPVMPSAYALMGFLQSPMPVFLGAHPAVVSAAAWDDEGGGFGGGLTALEACVAAGGRRPWPADEGSGAGVRMPLATATLVGRTAVVDVGSRALRRSSAPGSANHASAASTQGVRPLASAGGSADAAAAQRLHRGSRVKSVSLLRPKWGAAGAAAPKVAAAPASIAGDGAVESSRPLEGGASPNAAAEPVPPVSDSGAVNAAGGARSPTRVDSPMAGSPDAAWWRHTYGHILALNGGYFGVSAASRSSGLNEAANTSPETTRVASSGDLASSGGGDGGAVRPNGRHGATPGRRGRRSIFSAFFSNIASSSAAVSGVMSDLVIAPTGSLLQSTWDGLGMAPDGRHGRATGAGGDGTGGRRRGSSAVPDVFDPLDVYAHVAGSELDDDGSDDGTSDASDSNTDDDRANGSVRTATPQSTVGQDAATSTAGISAPPASAGLAASAHVPSAGGSTSPAPVPMRAYSPADGASIALERESSGPLTAAQSGGPDAYVAAQDAQAGVLAAPRVSTPTNTSSTAAVAAVPAATVGISITAPAPAARAGLDRLQRRLSRRLARQSSASGRRNAAVVAAAASAAAALLNSPLTSRGGVAGPTGMRRRLPPQRSLYGGDRAAACAVVVVDLDADAVSPGYLPPTHVLPSRLALRLWRAILAFAPLNAWCFPGPQQLPAPPPLPDMPTGVSSSELSAAHALAHRFESRANARGWDAAITFRDIALDGASSGGGLPDAIMSGDVLFAPYEGHPMAVRRGWSSNDGAEVSDGSPHLGNGGHVAAARLPSHTSAVGWPPATAVPAVAPNANMAIAPAATASVHTLDLVHSDEDAGSDVERRQRAAPQGHALPGARRVPRRRSDAGLGEALGTDLWAAGEDAVLDSACLDGYGADASSGLADDTAPDDLPPQLDSLPIRVVPPWEQWRHNLSARQMADAPQHWRRILLAQPEADGEPLRAAHATTVVSARTATEMADAPFVLVSEPPLHVSRLRLEALRVMVSLFKAYRAYVRQPTPVGATPGSGPAPLARVRRSSRTQPLAEAVNAVMSAQVEAPPVYVAAMLQLPAPSVALVDAHPVTPGKDAGMRESDHTASSAATAPSLVDGMGGEAVTTRTDRSTGEARVVSVAAVDARLVDATPLSVAAERVDEAAQTSARFRAASSVEASSPRAHRRSTRTSRIPRAPGSNVRSNRPTRDEAAALTAVLAELTTSPVPLRPVHHVAAPAVPAPMTGRASSTGDAPSSVMSARSSTTRATSRMMQDQHAAASGDAMLHPQVRAVSFGEQVSRTSSMDSSAAVSPTLAATPALTSVVDSPLTAQQLPRLTLNGLLADDAGGPSTVQLEDSGSQQVGHHAKVDSPRRENALRGQPEDEVIHAAVSTCTTIVAPPEPPAPAAVTLATPSFDTESFLADEAPPDAEALLVHVVKATQMWSAFVEERITHAATPLLSLPGTQLALTAPVPRMLPSSDLFDRLCLSRMFLRAWRHVHLRSKPHSGQLFKAIRGTLAKSWKRRLFELTGPVLAYYAQPDRLEACTKVVAALRAQLDAMLLDTARPSAAQSGITGTSGAVVASRVAADAEHGALAAELAAASSELAALRVASIRSVFYLVPGRTEVVIPSTTATVSVSSGIEPGTSAIVLGAVHEPQQHADQANVPRNTAADPAQAASAAFPTPYVFQLVNPSLKDVAAMQIARANAAAAAGAVARTNISNGTDTASSSGGVAQRPSTPRAGEVDVFDAATAGAVRIASGNSLTPAEAAAYAGPSRDVLTLCADSAEERREWILFLKSRLRSQRYAAALATAYLGDAATRAAGDVSFLRAGADSSDPLASWRAAARYASSMRWQ